MEDDEPLPPDSSERRKVQNRNAQRKFRNRRHRLQVNQALQLHGTIPPVQPVSWPLLYDSEVLAEPNLPLPSQQPYSLAPQCDLSALGQQPQVSSQSAYGGGTISASENTADQLYETVFPNSASDSQPMVNDAVFLNSAFDSENLKLSYFSSLNSGSPMFENDVASAFTMPISAFSVPPHDSSNRSTAISIAESRSIRPMASDPHTAQAPYRTSPPPPGSNPQVDFPTTRNPQHPVPPPAPQQDPESGANSPDHPDSESNDSSSNSNNSSNHPTPASSNPIEYDDTMSVLHIASHRGHTAVLTILLTHNLDPNEPDGSGRLPLHLAAMNGHTTVISLLLSHGACINAIDSLGRTALHWAVLGGHEAVVKVFLDAGGADLNLRDRNDWCVLHVAVERGFEGTLRMLLLHGADLGLKARKCEGWKIGEREAEDESRRERVVMGE